MLVGLPGHAPRDTSPVGRLGAGIEAAAMTGPGIFSSLLAGSAPAGYAELVQGTIVQIELNDLEDPLAYLHGPYRSVQELDDRP
jgi:hypothetical protein